MEKMGIAALIIGLILIGAGIYGVYVFLPDVLTFIKGVIGIVGIIIGLFLAIFGALMLKD